MATAVSFYTRKMFNDNKKRLKFCEEKKNHKTKLHKNVWLLVDKNKSSCYFEWKVAYDSHYSSWAAKTKWCMQSVSTKKWLTFIGRLKIYFTTTALQLTVLSCPCALGQLASQGTTTTNIVAKPEQTTYHGIQMRPGSAAAHS